MFYFLECGRTYQVNSATFTPPVYINETPPENGIKCEWRITATHGEKILLNITGLDIEKSQDCKSDYIEVRDGYWHKSQILGLFCGTGQFHNIMSTGSRMLITYVSKNPKGHKGFKGSFEGKYIVIKNKLFKMVKIVFQQFVAEIL